MSSLDAAIREEDREIEKDPLTILERMHAGEACLSFTRCKYCPLLNGDVCELGTEDISTKEKWDNYIKKKMQKLFVKSPQTIQIGGDHYKSMKLDILEYMCLNSSTEELFGALRKDVMKYIWRKKGNMSKRIEDLEKARHTLDVYLEELKGRENE